MSTPRSCKLCEWGYSDPRYPPTGRFQCRRSPPSIAETRRWPQVTEHEWCGEFRVRTPEGTP